MHASPMAYDKSGSASATATIADLQLEVILAGKWYTRFRCRLMGASRPASGGEPDLGTTARSGGTPAASHLQLFGNRKRAGSHTVTPNCSRSVEIGRHAQYHLHAHSRGSFAACGSTTAPGTAQCKLVSYHDGAPGWANRKEPPLQAMLVLVVQAGTVVALSKPRQSSSWPQARKDYKHVHSSYLTSMNHTGTVPEPQPKK